MRYFFLLLFAGISTLTVDGQITSDIRERIIPLHSNRSDVEKLATSGKDYLAWHSYETEYGKIDVFYSEEKCVGHGWNIEPDTVLAYRFYPKTSFTLEEGPQEIRTWVKTSDDIASSIFTNVADGIIFVFDQQKVLFYISYLPTEKDSGLRCSGFPKFSPLPYSPSDSFLVRDSSTWDIGLVELFIRRINGTHELKGYIFIYAERGKKDEVQRLQKKIENMAYDLIKADRQKVEIIFGGFRDKTEIEAYSIPKDYPPPVAQPYYADEQLK